MHVMFGTLQITVKHKKTANPGVRSDKDSLEDDTITTGIIKSGTVIACYLDKYDEEEPQLGQVTQDTECNADMEVEWMVGTYTESWRLWKQRKGETWKERIPSNSILFPVTLNSNKRLSNSTISKLKLKYQNIRTEH